MGNYLVKNNNYEDLIKLCLSEDKKITKTEIKKKIEYLKNKGINLDCHFKDSDLNNNYKDYFNDTPLVVACKNNNKIAVECLLELGADINLNSQNINLTTPLIEACDNLNLELVKILVENKKIEINKMDFHKNTALLVTCRNIKCTKRTDKNYIKIKNIIKILLKNKADLNCRNLLGKTILTYSIGTKKIFNFFLGDNKFKEVSLFDVLYYLTFKKISIKKFRAMFEIIIKNTEDEELIKIFNKLLAFTESKIKKTSKEYQNYETELKNVNKYEYQSSEKKKIIKSKNENNVLLENLKKIDEYLLNRFENIFN